jgi:hypothetical protein
MRPYASPNPCGRVVGAKWPNAGRSARPGPLAQQTTKEIVARDAVARQRLTSSNGRNWLHRLLRTDNPARVLEHGVVEMCDVAVAGGNDYELRRYEVFFRTAADLIVESRLRGELPDESDHARRIRELRLELEAQVALERARQTKCPKALRAFADAQTRDAANDLAEASRARIEAEIALARLNDRMMIEFLGVLARCAAILVVAVIARR